MAEETTATQTEITEPVDTQTEPVDTSATEGTQDANPSSQADASSDAPVTSDEVGISKPDTEAEGESVDVGSAISELVNAALNGELTDEQKADIEAAGLGQHFDMIVEAQQAKIEANNQEIFSVVGGKEAYGELQEWAVANLSDSEIEAFNKAVLHSGDLGVAKLAVEGLQARYARENGQAPNKVIESGGTVNESNRPFASVDDYINETMSMKYRTDPAYAAEVERKRNLSGF